MIGSGGGFCQTTRRPAWRDMTRSASSGKIRGMSKRRKAAAEESLPKAAAPAPAPRPADHWPLTAALLLVLLFHLPALFTPFQFDDFHHLARNPALSSLRGIGRLWTDPKTYTAVPGAAGLYRPLLMTSHALTVAGFGRGPFGFHLVNLCLHLLNVGLAFSLFRRWGAGGWAAALAAAFFGLLAANQETVAYAAARSTLLAGAFGLGAALLAEEPANARRAAAAGLCLLLGLLSKEIAAVVPAFLLARDLTVGGPGALRRRWPYYAAALAALAVYAAARLALLPALPPTYTGRSGYFFGQGRVIIYYLIKSLLPWRLTIYPGIPVSGGTAVDLLAWAALLVPTAAVLVYRRRLGLAGLGWLWFLAGFAVTSSIFPLLLTSSLERVYLPSIGLAAIGLEVWRRTFAGGRRQRTAAALVAGVVLLNGAATAGLYSKWHSPLALWRRAAQTAPQTGLPWLWLGQTEMEAERYRPAEIDLIRALKLEPRDAYTQMAVANLYLLTGRVAQARSIWAGALQPGGPREAQQLDALVGLAGLDLAGGRLEQALARAQEALKDFPDSPDALFIAGAAAARLGDDARGQEYLTRALELSPGDPAVSSELGLLLLRQGQFDRAEDLLRAAEAGGADDANTLAGLGIVAMQKMRLTDARNKFERSLAKDPKNFLALLGLALHSAGAGDFAQALDYADRAAAVDPESGQLHDLRARIRLDLAARATGDERKRTLDLARPDVEWLAEHGAPDRKQQWLGLAGQ